MQLPARSTNATRHAFTALFAAAVLTLTAACASVRSGPGTEAQAGGSSTAPATSSTPTWPQQAAYQLLTESCRATIRPDRAVIVGGMSASGIKPTDTAALLQRQIDALKTVADEERGTLRLIEQVRAARSSNPRSRRTGEPVQDPYVVLQRLELELPVDADIDRVLERTLQTGLDRYGSTAGVEPAASGSRPLVVYRFSELDSLLRSAHAECRRSAVRSWCETRGDTGSCVAALESPQTTLTTERFFLGSQPVTMADGTVGSLDLSWPSASVGHVELGGDAELHLSGAISLRVGPGFR